MGDASGCNIVFRIENNNIKIIQCGTYYRDKQKYELKEYSVTAELGCDRVFFFDNIITKCNI